MSPIDYGEYPADWRFISRRIREGRAGGRCECVGTCGWHVGRCEAINGEPHPVTTSRVVLTVAHHPDPTPANVCEDNLHAWCQRCHLAVDSARHVANRRFGRQHSGPNQLRLSLEEGLHAHGGRRGSE